MSKKDGLIAFHADKITRQFHKNNCNRIDQRLRKLNIKTNPSEIARRVIKIHHQHSEVFNRIVERVVEDFKNHP